MAVSSTRRVKPRLVERLATQLPDKFAFVSQNRIYYGANIRDACMIQIKYDIPICSLELRSIIPSSYFIKKSRIELISEPGLTSLLHPSPLHSRLRLPRLHCSLFLIQLQ